MLDEDFAAYIRDRDPVVRTMEVIPFEGQYAIQVQYDDYLALEERIEIVMKLGGVARLFPSDSQARAFIAFIQVHGVCPPD